MLLNAQLTAGARSRDGSARIVAHGSGVARSPTQLREMHSVYGRHTGRHLLATSDCAFPDPQCATVDHIPRGDRRFETQPETLDWLRAPAGRSLKEAGCDSDTNGRPISKHPYSPAVLRERNSTDPGFRLDLFDTVQITERRGTANGEFETARFDRSSTSPYACGRKAGRRIAPASRS
jgi:hypothetical protein